MHSRSPTKSFNADYENLELKISLFEKSKFPSLSIPSKTPEKRHKATKRVKSPEDNSSVSPHLTPIRYKIPKTRLTGSSPKGGFRLCSSFNSNLGPGDYDPIQRSITPGGYISVGPRFDRNFIEKVKSFLLQRRSANKSDEILQKVFTKNRDMAQHSPENRELMKTERGNREKIKLEITKISKKLIDSRTRDTKELK